MLFNKIRVERVIIYAICVTSALDVAAEGELCHSKCHWLSWESWSHCSESCGGNGTRSRNRPLCCPHDEDKDTCVKNCGHSNNDAYNRESCGICFNDGVFNWTEYVCHCKERFFGHCCEESKYRSDLMYNLVNIFSDYILKSFVSS